MTIELLPKRSVSSPGEGLEPVVLHWVEKPAQAHQAARSADSRAVWIIRKTPLANQLLRKIEWPSRRAGYLILQGSARPEILPALMKRFEKVAYSFAISGFLPRKELIAVLKSPDRTDRFIGGMTDRGTRTVTLWRGDFMSMVVPFSAFTSAANGIKPDWDRFAVTDFGHTLKFGSYEAAADAILYEYDSDFRRRFKKTRLATEQTLGASIRRLRQQRQLTRYDFPGIDPKTLARIERREVAKPHDDTLQSIADRLGVSIDELETF